MYLYNYAILHRVDRVPGFLSSRPNWLPPPPQPQASVASRPLVPGRGGHTRLREKGVEEPVQTKGHSGTQGKE